MEIYYEPGVEQWLTIWFVEQELVFWLFIALAYNWNIGLNPGMYLSKAWDINFTWSKIDLIWIEFYHHCLKYDKYLKKLIFLHKSLYGFWHLIHPCCKSCLYIYFLYLLWMCKDHQNSLTPYCECLKGFGRVLYLDHDLDMVTGLWCTHIQNFGSVYWGVEKIHVL